MRVRQYTPDDKDYFFSLSGDADVMRYIRPVSTKEESDKFLHENIAFYREYPTRGRWAVEEKENGKFAGSFAIIAIPSKPGSLQLGYSLLPENWGKGFATELTVAGLRYFFSNEEFPEIFGVTEMANTASQKVLLKAGFKTEATFKEDGKDLMLFRYTKQTYLSEMIPV
jgi:ribosomal-protein-alanine N-acetyltransferase